MVRAMRTLLHTPLDPGGRFVRLALAEKGLVARLIDAATSPEELLRLNPAGIAPVLVDEPPTGGELAIAPAAAIAEYLDEVYRDPALLPSTSAGRAEARRLFFWFEGKFDAEVNALIVRKRIDTKPSTRRWGEPEPLRPMQEAMAWHLDYLNFLLERRSFLAGDRLSAADLAGAAHLSTNDYFGFVPWAEFPEVNAWYQRMKSRPSMRPLLADRIDGSPPAPHYADLDF